MYLEWAYQLYNVVFTALPILLFAVLDRDYTDQRLINNPSWYARTLGGKLFTWKIFCGWMLDSLYESCVLTLVPFWCYALVTSADGTGHSHGLWSFGVVTYTAIVFCANLRLAFITVHFVIFLYFYIYIFIYICTLEIENNLSCHSRLLFVFSIVLCDGIKTSWTGWMHLVLWGSIVAFFICMIILNLSSAFANAGADYYWVVFTVIGTGWFFFFFVAEILNLYECLLFFSKHTTKKI
ncbi:p-type ATPase2 [Reticulomyxa filosa]|uniref:p-type ATPase2 n=1 Tax=Reticulomyxa filosa TaxID=46433 RepID=X6N9Z6_RETFI|nr:p-type ATPase2 [Reticulomyxa filosa]|eukprot:ETO22127.1 p-type ATPase2 [Reticulomyxa filosa]